MTQAQGPTDQAGGTPPAPPPPPPPASYPPPGAAAPPGAVAPPGTPYQPAPAKPKKPVYKKWWFWALIVIVLIIIISVIANSGGSSNKTTTSGTASPTTAAGGQTAGGQQKLTVGQTGKTGDFEATLNAVTDPYASTNQFVQPAAGTRFVAVDVTMRNVSNDQQPVSSALSFELTDSTGQKYNETFAPGLTAIDGLVPPNDQRRGTMVYQVPLTATGLELRVRGDISSGGTVFTLG